MSEYVTRIIKIELLRDPDGHPVCMTRDKTCAMLLSSHMGTVSTCSDTGGRPERDIIGVMPIGWMRPLPDCKIWAEYATQKANND